MLSVQNSTPVVLSVCATVSIRYENQFWLVERSVTMYLPDGVSSNEPAALHVIETGTEPA